MAQYNTEAARNERQLAKMRDLTERGVCMFCPEHIHKEAPGTVEAETSHWIVKHNDFPYDDTRLHVLIIPKKHVSYINDLSKSAKQEFLEVVQATALRHKLKSYAIAMRVGDMRYNGGSIEHMHAHLIVGDVDNPNHQPVRFKVSSRPKD
nr:HIT domain protein [uncultured bacterium]